MASLFNFVRRRAADQKPQPPAFSTESVYPGPNVVETNPQFFERFCVWAGENDFSRPQFLLPQIRQTTRDGLYAIEERFLSSGLQAPSNAQIQAFGEWDYDLRWGSVSTCRDKSLPEIQFGSGCSATLDSIRAFHRYRVS